MPFLTLPDGSSDFVIKPERIPPPDNGSDIYISVLTAPVYHESRFALQYVTWLQTVDPKNVSQSHDLNVSHTTIKVYKMNDK